jgi:hypothetical protein
MRLLTWVRERFQRRAILTAGRDPVWDDADVWRPMAAPVTGEVTITYEPHGIDTPETLAALREKAEADALAAQASAQTEQWGTWDEPGTPLAPAAEPGPPPPMPPSDLSRAMVSQIPFPPPNDRNFDWTHKYADYMRRVGVATGTSTDLEHTMAWGVPALEPGDGTGVKL